MQCPVCRADNSQGPQCRRCRADLSLLLQLEDQRQHLQAEAMVLARQGRLDDALAAAQAMDALGRDEASRRFLAVLRLLARDFDGAMQAYTTQYDR